MSLGPSADLAAAQRALTQATRLYDFLLQQHNAGYGSRSHPSPSIQTLLAFLPAFADSDRITTAMDQVVGSSAEADQARAELEIAQEALCGAVTREQVAQSRVKELEVEVARLQSDLRMFTHMLNTSNHVGGRAPGSASPAKLGFGSVDDSQKAAPGTCGSDENRQVDDQGGDAQSRRPVKRASQLDPLDLPPPRPAKQARHGSSFGASASQSAVHDELRSEHDWLMSTQVSGSTTESQVSVPPSYALSPIKPRPRTSSAPPTSPAPPALASFQTALADLPTYLLPRTYAPNHLLLDFSAAYLPDPTSPDLTHFPTPHLGHQAPSTRYFLPDSRTLFAQRIRDAAKLKSKRQLEISDYVLEHALDKLVGYLNVNDALKGSSLDCVHRVFGKLSEAPFVMVCEVERAVVGQAVWDEVVGPELAQAGAGNGGGNDQGDAASGLGQCEKMVVMGTFVVRGTIAYFVQRFVFV